MYADRVKESTTTTGTGAITLGGAATGFQSFATAFANPSIVSYVISSNGGSEWEVGVGTFTTTLSRDRVLASSNSNALVSFSAGTKDVYCDVPAKQVVNKGLATALAMGLARS